MMQVISYGGGVNSTAMLIGLWEHGEDIAAILFADTGGEKPRTYASILEVTTWCLEVGFPAPIIVRSSQPQQRIDGSLEAECLRLGVLPSRTYGFGSCSMKWKRDPQDLWKAAYVRETGHRVVTLIGYDADEAHRADRGNFQQGDYRFPLLEWKWGRKECIAAIQRAGLLIPPKSACFFCPSSRPSEVLQLARDYPDLAARARDLEERALRGAGPAPALRHIRGLGRRWSWGELIDADTAQQKLFPDSGLDVPCGCYDGEEDEE